MYSTGVNDNSAQPVSVSEFLDHVNILLTNTPVFVEGEIAGVRVSQGKWLHFDLKDEQEDALVQCFAPVFRIRTPLEDGMRVRVRGVARIYPRFGKFSITLESVELFGEGALRRAFELLRKKLEEEGLFNPDRKRALPYLPEKIGLITSQQAAAYDDFLKVLQKRRGGIEIRFLPVSVQGKDAPAQLKVAIEHINEYHQDLDAVVLVRGGGNLEDLHAFNDEIVIRAITCSRVPTVVGVGHERDVTLADLVSDVRASTPSNAAELLTPTRGEVLRNIDAFQRRLCTAQRDALDYHARKVVHSVAVLRESVARPLRAVDSLSHRMDNVGRMFYMVTTQYRSSIDNAERRTRKIFRSALRDQGDQLVSLERMMASLHPKHVLARGYSITKTSEGAIVRDAQDVSHGDTLTSVLGHGILHSVVCQNKQQTLRKRTKNSNRSSRNSNQGTLM